MIWGAREMRTSREVGTETFCPLDQEWYLCLPMKGHYHHDYDGCHD